MEQSVTPSVASPLAGIYAAAGTQFTTEKEVIARIYKQIAAQKMRVSHKDIIMALLEKLETERDVIQLDIYRQALEIVIQHTPADIAP